MDASALIAARRFALIKVRKEVHRSPQRGCEVGKLEPSPPLLTVITVVRQACSARICQPPLLGGDRLASSCPGTSHGQLCRAWSKPSGLPLRLAEGAVGTGSWRVDPVGVIDRVRPCARA